MRHHAAESGTQPRVSSLIQREQSDFCVQQAGKIGMGRQIVEEDVPQQVGETILQPAVVGFYGRTGSLGDQYRKIPQGILKNRVLGFEGFDQTGFLGQNFRLTFEKLLDLFSIAPANKWRSASQAGSGSSHFFQLLDKGIVRAKKFVPGTKQIAVDFGIQLFHPLQIPHEPVVLQRIHGPLLNEQECQQ
jgi:hypothetical protein